MSFKEKHLVETLATLLKKEFATDVAFRELSAGYGIADLVFAADFTFGSQARHFRPPITNFTSLQVYLTIQATQRCLIEELVSAIPGIDRSEIRRHLSCLARGGYIEVVGNTISQIVDYSVPNPINKVVAIEAKLTDHRSGLVQARRYQYFADESYLAILKGTVSDDDIAELSSFNIGLILFNREDGTVEISHPQSQSKLFHDNLNLFAKEIMVDSFARTASLAR